MIDEDGGQAGVDAMFGRIHIQVNADQPREQAATAIVEGMLRLHPDARLGMASLRDQLELYQSEGLVDPSAAIETVVDPSYVEVAAKAMDLILRGVSHRYGGTSVLEGIDLTIPAGRIMCVVGPSGCGKSTLLRLIGGLERPEAGEIVQVGAPPGGSINPLTYVFRDFAFLPWRSAAGNVALVFEDHPLGRAGRERRVAGVVARTGLTEFAGAWPRQLSGGMKQRVAIARALAVDPAVMLMDEPLSALSALDAQTRELLMDDLVSRWSRTPFTAVYVAHYLAEAVRLGHVIVALPRRPGRVREVVRIDAPTEARAAGEPVLEAVRRRLWETMRGEARAADAELADG